MRPNCVKLACASLAAAVVGASPAGADEVVWRLSPTRRIHTILTGGVQQSSRTAPRGDPNTISSYSGAEKAWMSALFPGARYGLYHQPGERVPDEYLVLSDGSVVGRDDLVTMPAGSDGSHAVVMVVRPADGLVPIGTPGLEPEASSGTAGAVEDELEVRLYSDQPAAPAPSPGPPPVPAPVLRVDRARLASWILFAIVKETAAGIKILARSRSPSPRSGEDLLRFRGFDFAGGRAFELATTWRQAVGSVEAVQARYQVFTRGAWGIVEAIDSVLLAWGPDRLERRAVRFGSRTGEGGELELVTQEVDLADHPKAPDPAGFLPPIGGGPGAFEGGGVVRILQLREGRFRLAGWADLAKGDRPVELRKNWPNYQARRVSGPPALLSFGTPGSPFEIYPCPWPDHPVREVPWVSDRSLYKGSEHFSGRGDLGLAVWTQNDTQALYLMAVVRDDRLVLPSLGQDPASGDHMQLWLDPAYGKEGLLLELSPGNPPGAGAQARIRSPATRSGPAPLVRVAARPFESGYWLEAGIPFSFLEAIGMRPAGSLWGLAVNAVDLDDPGQPDRKTVLSTSSRFEWAKTETLNNLILE